MKKIWKRYNIEIMIFLFFCIELVLRMPAKENLDSWCTTYFTVSYEFGFSSRLLIGSLVKLLFPRLETSMLYVVMTLSAMAVAFAASILAGRFIRKADESIREMIIYIVMLWIASPASVAYLFLQNTFGRMDTFLLLYTLILVLVCLKGKTQKNGFCALGWQFWEC